MAEVIKRRAELKNPSPMMSQYFEVKNQYLDYILFYRLGDFYEMFFEDAIAASEAMDLTLTGRDCGDGKRATMCGIPFHKVDLYLGRMVEAGFKVAVCEQMEDPATAKGIVKREVIRIVTPGTITDENLLSEGSHNYLASLYYGSHSIALAIADISTGEVLATEIDGEDRDLRILSELSIYQPKEIVLNIKGTACPTIVSFLKRQNCMIEEEQKHLFNLKESIEREEIAFGDKKRDLASDELRLSVGALLAYIRETQKTEDTFVSELTVYTAGQYMELDHETRRNLELLETMRQKEKKGTLLWVLDHTKTCLGARLLRSWIARPLISAPAIVNRQSAVEEFVTNFEIREAIREALIPVHDLERLTAKSVYGVGNAKDLRSICESIKTLPEMKAVLLDAKSKNIRQIAENMDTLEDIHTLLESAICEVPPYSIREGGMIAKGYSEEVDYLREVSQNSDDLLHQIEEREREQTGIKTLRVSYNKVFGFYIEVPRSQADVVPGYYIRKQTLVSSERYITQELKELEGTVLGAQDKLCALEFEIFSKIRMTIAENSSRIQRAAMNIASLDVYCSLADVAIENNYIKPDVDYSEETIIEDGRHPVVEKFVTDSYFVPNDTKLDTKSNRMMLITGPNMAGKSTYMRQVALITIMAQIGSFVPARHCHIGIVDRVFTRVGASDDLASGQSTFMIEMNEVANILKNATKRSLIVFDEVGRGTSTYDGMSIARAVVEYTASKKIGARTMFATHYHELTALEGVCDGVVNYHIVAKKNQDSITFLRKIVPGATDDSYGIEVAKLAGVPNEVIKRAREVLHEIEEGNGVQHVPAMAKEIDPMQDLFSSLKNTEAEEVANKLREVNLDTLTPIEAMNLLFQLKKMLQTR